MATDKINGQIGSSPRVIFKVVDAHMTEDSRVQWHKYRAIFIVYTIFIVYIVHRYGLGVECNGDSGVLTLQ